MVSLFGSLLPFNYPMQKKMTVPIITHRLTYSNRGGEGQHEDIFQVRDVLRVSTNATDHSIHALVYQLLHDGVLVVKSSSSSKSVLAGVRYVIAKAVSDGLAVHDYFLDSLDGLKKLLAEGWKVCRFNPAMDTYLDVLLPSDSDKLVEVIDLGARWREVVAAVFNREIERNCNWSTNGHFAQLLTAAVKNMDVVVPADCPFLDPGERLTAEEFVSAYVVRGLETHLNSVYDFIRADPNALYFAEPTPLGVDVGRYADVRALLWYRKDEQERQEREQQIEEGLTS